MTAIKLGGWGEGAVRDQLLELKRRREEGGWKEMRGNTGSRDMVIPQ
jgi:hypothetical protein